MGVLNPIFVASLLVFIGYMANYLFQTKKLPESTLLIIMGILLGPLFSIINVESITKIAPLFSAIAVAIILFEGGLNLDLFQTIKAIPYATLLAIINAFLSIVFTAIISRFFLNWDWIYGILLGSILSGISGPVVISILSGISVDEKTKTTLSVESSITDAFTILLSLAIINSLAFGNVNIHLAVKDIASAYSVGTLLGLVFGIIWISLLRKLKGKFSYMLTLAFLFMIYTVSEELGGSGAITALIFGLVLGNSEEVAKMLKLGRGFEVDNTLKIFHEEITFFIRTFFFVYLGLIFDLKLLSMKFIIISAIISLLLVAARYITSEIVSSIAKIDKKVTSIMTARGLGAAVVATIPFYYGLKNSLSILGFTTAGIILTNLINALLVMIVERSKLEENNSLKKKNNF